MKIQQLAHVCFFTDDAPRLLGFYQDAFGFPLAFEMKRDDNGATFGWYLDTGKRSFIEIFDQKGAVAQWGGEVAALKQGGGHYRHFCFEVEGLGELRRELEGKGYAVTEMVKGMDHSYQCWIKDPDGNDIELMEYTAESLQFAGGEPQD